MDVPAGRWIVMTARPIIIDCDPGQDDAVALLLAMASPDELEIRGITCVAGNVPLALTEANARRLCELAGRPDAKVFAGCVRPMVRSLVTAEHVHGTTGLDGSGLPEPRMALQAGHAVDWLVETLMAAGEREITLCALGPLTNVAMAMVREPAILPKIREIVMMGGGFFEGGNVTPAAEFNIYVDPHAAHVVFGSGIPITLMPLDVTHKAIATSDRIAAFRDLGTAAGRSVAGMLSFSERHDVEKYNAAGGPLHDPTTVAYLLDPGLFEGRRCNVQIVRDGAARGMTMVDWWRVTGREPNAMVMNQIDADGFFALLVDRIGRLG